MYISRCRYLPWTSFNLPVKIFQYLYVKYSRHAHATYYENNFYVIKIKQKLFIKLIIFCFHFKHLSSQNNTYSYCFGLLKIRFSLTRCVHSKSPNLKSNCITENEIFFTQRGYFYFK